MEKAPLKPRIAVYTHDTFGLGHVRRCLHIIRRLASEVAEAAILFITGSPALHYLTHLPPNVDILKLPTIVKTGTKGSLPPHLPLGIPAIIDLRSSILKQALLSFRPDLFLVDNFPLGAHAELLPSLKELHSLGTKSVLGLRDIVECPEAVRSDWRKQGIYDALDRYYDKILIYGVREIFDAIREYNIPEQIARKIHFCGYLTATDTAPPLAENIRSKYGVKGPLILATGGGGGDAFPLLSTLIQAVSLIPDSHTLIFAGPLMGEKDKQALLQNTQGKPGIVFQDFVHDLRPYLRESDLLVSMCGYNIASEIVFHGTRAVIAPRTWRFGEHAQRAQTNEEKEQILRGRLMAQHGYVSLIEPEELNPENLKKVILAALEKPARFVDHQAFKMDGLHNAIEELRGCLSLRI